MTGPAIVWLRDDLRLGDNPALRAALDRGGPMLLLYLFDQDSPGIRPLGGATRWWLHHSLTALAADVRERGGRLVLRRGAAEDVLPALVAETGAEAVFWNRRYSAAREIDARVKSRLRAGGAEVGSFAANLLVEPWEVTTDAGEPYKVFTPFWRAVREREMREPLPTPRALPASPQTASDDLDDWELLPSRADWAEGLRETWEPGEGAGHRRLEAFAKEGLADYHRRDEPAVSTSGLSPHLRFGEISPAQVWDRLHGDLAPEARRNAAGFLSELGWRDFNWAILYANPDLATKNYRQRFDDFDPSGHYVRRWVPSDELIAPIVDLAASRREALEAFSTLRR